MHGWLAAKVIDPLQSDLDLVSSRQTAPLCPLRGKTQPTVIACSVISKLQNILAGILQNREP